MRTSKLFPALFLLIITMFATAAEPAGSLTLRGALAIALTQNPELEAFDWDIRAAEARIVQAGLRPNPELAITAEDVTGTGELSSGKQAERTLQLSQLVELGGKRPARIAEASAGRDVAEWEYQVRRVGVLRDTTRAFVEVLAAQRRLAFAEETLSLTENQVPVTQQRVEVGRASAVEGVRANVAVATSRIAVEQARRDIEIARGLLAAQLGLKRASFGDVVGDLDHVDAIPSMSTVTAQLFGNPQLARWTAERERREAVLRVQQAQAVPDLTASAGPRVIGRGESVSSGVVGVSMPLPLFNRNQGNIAEAHANLAKTEDERRAAEARLFAELTTAHQTLSRAAEEARVLKETVIPGATQAVELLTEGYSAGRFSQIEILDARRTLTEARGQYIRATADFHRALADLEALTAAPIELQRHHATPKVQIARSRSGKVPPPATTTRPKAK